MNGPDAASTRPALKQNPAPVARIRVGYSSGKYTGNPLNIPFVKNPSRGSISNTVLYKSGTRKVAGNVAAAPSIMIKNAPRLPILSAIGGNARYPTIAPAFKLITA